MVQLPDESRLQFKFTGGLKNLSLALIGIGVGGWLFRAAGQAATGNAPKFRDMPYGVALGYALGAALVLWAIYYYFQPVLNEQGTANAGVMFFRWGVQGLILSFVVAYLFRQIGRLIGTEGSKKVFRSMPLTE